MPKQTSRLISGDIPTPGTLSRTPQDVNTSSAEPSLAFALRSLQDDFVSFMVIGSNEADTMEGLFEAIRTLASVDDPDQMPGRLLTIKKLAAAGGYIARDESDRQDCAAERAHETHIPALLALVHGGAK